MDVASNCCNALTLSMLLFKINLFLSWARWLKIKRSLELAYCRPSSKVSERVCLKGISGRGRCSTSGLLTSTLVLACVCVRPAALILNHNNKPRVHSIGSTGMSTCHQNCFQTTVEEGYNKNPTSCPLTLTCESWSVCP